MKRIIHCLFLMTAVILFAACTVPAEEPVSTASGPGDTPEEILAAFPSSYQEIISRDDIVIETVDDIRNGHLWESFLKSTDGHDPAQVCIVRFTLEGDPIIYLIEYDGQAYHWSVDNTRDTFSADHTIRSGMSVYLLELEEGDSTWYVLADEILANMHQIQHTEKDGTSLSAPVVVLVVSSSQPVHK